jgi:hypothetical protein
MRILVMMEATQIDYQVLTPPKQFTVRATKRY